jgi:hypothetical protein
MEGFFHLIASDEIDLYLTIRAKDIDLTFAVF